MSPILSRSNLNLLRLTFLLFRALLSDLLGQSNSVSFFDEMPLSFFILDNNINKKSSLIVGVNNEVISFPTLS